MTEPSAEDHARFAELAGRVFEFLDSRWKIGPATYGISDDGRPRMDTPLFMAWLEHDGRLRIHQDRHHSHGTLVTVDAEGGVTINHTTTHSMS